MESIEMPISIATLQADLAANPLLDRPGLLALHNHSPALALLLNSDMGRLLFHRSATRGPDNEKREASKINELAARLPSSPPAPERCVLTTNRGSGGNGEP